MKFNKVKMKITRETAFFGGLSAWKVGCAFLQRPLYSLILSLVLIMPCAHAVAESGSFSGPRSVQECRKDLSVRLSVLDSFEQVAVSQQSVLCAFRPKNGGFPSVSVVFEPLPPRQSEQRAEQRGEDVVRSYHLVGLTDATLHSAEAVTLDGRPGYRLELFYTSSGVPMVALVVQVDAQDVRYTVTGTDTAEGYQRSKDELRHVAESLMLPVPREAEAPAARHGWSPTAVMSVIGGCVAALFFVWLIGRRWGDRLFRR